MENLRTGGHRPRHIPNQASRSELLSYFRNRVGFLEIMPVTASKRAEPDPFHRKKPINPHKQPKNDARNLPIPHGNLPIGRENLPIPGGNLPIRRGNLPIPADNLPIPDGNPWTRRGNLPIAGGNLLSPRRNLPIRRRILSLPGLLQRPGCPLM